MTARELDEDDVRVRPARSSRPRTRTRPAHEEAATARVVTVDRGRYRLRLEDGGLITSVRARELGRRAVVVGDLVHVVGDLTGGPDALGRIVRIEPRTSVLRRTPDDTDPVERAVVANADLLVVVTALADPPPRPRLVDRCLVAAYDGGLEPLLCLSKSDLASPDELLSLYQPLGVEAVVTGPDSGVSELAARLAGRISVMFGQSGVGKSTLVNQLVPDAQRAVGEVSGVGKGRHTSSSVVALELPGGGTVIDTPGVRSFGLGAVSPDRVLASFPDVATAAAHCPPGCSHLPGTAGCTLDDADVSAARLDSLRRLLVALAEV
ncbi:MAG: ribosome biosis GTPase / thiamine phosphate phosphatase [Actinomycetota bacterium]|jgi:ribosome biogenesis GTPase|nr:ribosome biosis GTPase / thiamine phosphate phosphatase [Actinomycetota bacterium]